MEGTGNEIHSSISNVNVFILYVTTGEGKNKEENAMNEQYREGDSVRLSRPDNESRGYIRAWGLGNSRPYMVLAISTRTILIRSESGHEFWVWSKEVERYKQGWCMNV